MDAHAREADAAIAGMVEQYGGGHRVPDVGQWVHGTSRGKSFSGEVIEVRRQWVVIDVEGAEAVVELSDIEWN